MCLLMGFDTDPQCRWSRRSAERSRAGDGDAARCSSLRPRHGVYEFKSPVRAATCLCSGWSESPERRCINSCPEDLERSVLDALCRTYPQQSEAYGSRGTARSVREGLRRGASVAFERAGWNRTAIAHDVCRRAWRDRNIRLMAGESQQALADAPAIDARISRLQDGAAGRSGRSIVEDVAGGGAAQGRE